MAQKKPQHSKTQYELWQDTVNDGVTNRSWDAYDTTIQLEVGKYNIRFAPSSPGYKKVDWHLIKAMLWTESGGPTSKSWKTRPLQIGNSGDPAYGVLKSGKENSSVIMSDDLWKSIKNGDINKPTLNIRAAIAYLFTRMAKFETKSFLDETDPKPFTYPVVKGDTGLDAIATKVGSTLAVLQTLNPSKTKIIHPGDVIQCKKASMKTVVSGWRTFDSTTIADLYNGGGDSNYTKKLDYVLSLFKGLKRS